MKILIFENQKNTVQPSFDSVNDIFCDNELAIEYYPKSQDLVPFTKISEYEFVFIDISLAPNSNLDGIGILKKIKNENLNVNNIIVLTGDSRIEDKLNANGLFNIKTLFKPIDFTELNAIINN